MKVDLRRYGSDRGAYSLVVFSEDRTEAIKIFSRDHEREHATNVFQSEIAAYELASRDLEAANLTPEFMGSVQIESVIDGLGNDVTTNYYQDLAYKMSYERGPFYKLNTIDESERRRVTQIFRRLGIEYLLDCSASLGENGEVRCIIDFATQEFELWA